MEPKEENVTMYPPVPLQLAAQQTLNWRNYLAANPAAGANAFYIPFTDIQDITQWSANGGGIRIYLALKTPGDLSTIHVLVVPVDQHKDDICVSATGNSLVYDMSIPCPNLCSGYSALSGNTGPATAAEGNTVESSDVGE